MAVVSRPWDRPLVQKPFSRNLVAYGEPFTVLYDISNETALAKTLPRRHPAAILRAVAVQQRTDNGRIVIARRG